MFDDKKYEIWGEKTGFALGFFIFTTILYLVLILLKRMPLTWNYLHIIIITATITLIGYIMGRLLK